MRRFLTNLYPELREDISVQKIVFAYRDAKSGKDKTLVVFSKSLFLLKGCGVDFVEDRHRELATELFFLYIATPAMRFFVKKQ